MSNSCRQSDGRCAVCGGDWSVCGCQGALNRCAAAPASPATDASEVPAGCESPLVKRTVDLHEKASMPWSQAEELALSEFGFDDEDLHELIGEFEQCLEYLTDREQIESFARHVLVFGPDYIAKVPPSEIFAAPEVPAARQEQCAGCEGSPAAGNTPCGVCGAARQEGGETEGRALPWDDCKVAFGCDDDGALWRADKHGKLKLPHGWKLDGTDGSGARSVVIFRVEGGLWPEDGDRVKSALRRCGAVSHRTVHLAAAQAAPVAAEVTQTVALPNPGSPEASAMMDSVLAEYQWPINPKNAARAGWVAATRWLATPTASTSTAAPAGEPVDAHRCRNDVSVCKRKACEVECQYAHLAAPAGEVAVEPLSLKDVKIVHEKHQNVLLSRAHVVESYVAFATAIQRAAAAQWGLRLKESE